MRVVRQYKRNLQSMRGEDGRRDDEAGARALQDVWLEATHHIEDLSLPNVARQEDFVIHRKPEATCICDWVAEDSVWCVGAVVHRYNLDVVVGLLKVLEQLIVAVGVT